MPSARTTTRKGLDYEAARDEALRIIRGEAAIPATSPRSGQNGSPQPAKAARDLTVDDVLDAYLATCRASKGPQAMGTIASQCRIIRATAPAGPVVAIALHEWSRWRDSLVTPSRSAVTVNKLVATMKAAANALDLDGDLVKLRKYRAAGGRNEVAFGPDEVARLVEAMEAADRHGAAMVRAMWLTLARYGELSACRVRDVGRHALAIPSGKTGPRVAPLTATAAAFLADLAEGRPGDAPLVAQRSGRPFGHGTLRKSFNAALAVANLDARATPNSVRHSAITAWLVRGVPVHTVARCAGTSVEMVSAVYAHAVAAAEAAALASIDSALYHARPPLAVAEAAD